MPVMAGGALVEYHARACLLAKQEPQGPTLLKTLRSRPHGGACERLGLESLKTVSLDSRLTRPPPTLTLFRVSAPSAVTRN